MIGEIVQSYKKDKADLENHFNFIYGKMIAIHSGMGDTHNGKNVCEVEFENGTLFYKPRACLTDRFFEELCTRKRCYRDASCWIQRGMHRNNKKKKFCATSCF